MCLWRVSTDILNNNLGEFGNREILTVKGRFNGEYSTPFLFVLNSRISSPRKFPPPKRKTTPEERLRKYVEIKYGRLNVKKKEIVEKKS